MENRIINRIQELRKELSSLEDSYNDMSHNMMLLHNVESAISLAHSYSKTRSGIKRAILELESLVNNKE